MLAMGATIMCEIVTAPPGNELTLPAGSSHRPIRSALRADITVSSMEYLITNCTLCEAMVAKKLNRDSS